MTLIRFLDLILGALTLDPSKETPVTKIPQAAPIIEVPKAIPIPRYLKMKLNIIFLRPEIWVH